MAAAAATDWEQRYLALQKRFTEYQTSSQELEAELQRVSRSGSSSVASSPAI
jgi:hypothetical protein